MTEILHISSIVVTVVPAKLDRVSSSIEALEPAGIAVSDPRGRLIVTLEAGSESGIIRALDTIQLMPGVVSAALVYHQAVTDAGQPARSIKQGCSL